MIARGLSITLFQEVRNVHSDGNSDAQDLNDLRVILNDNYRWA